MNEELIKKYLVNKYGNSPLVELQDGYAIKGLFIYKNEEKDLRWYVNVEMDLCAWFGPGNYYNIIRDWFFEQFGKEIGYNK